MKTKHLLVAAALTGMAAGSVAAKSSDPGKPAARTEAAENSCSGAHGCSGNSCSGKATPAPSPTPKKSN